jgi:hypothetical protein
LYLLLPIVNAWPDEFVQVTVAPAVQFTPSPLHLLPFARVVGPPAGNSSWHR